MRIYVEVIKPKKKKKKSEIIRLPSSPNIIDKGEGIVNEDSKNKEIALQDSVENGNTVKRGKETTARYTECRPLALSIKLHVSGVSVGMCT